MRHYKPILLVEDDDVDTITVERALTDLKNQTNKKPCLILLDLNMPKMNGQEFLTIIKADDKLKKIPVVIHSTSNAREDINRSFELGAAGYMVKSQDYEKSKNTLSAIGKYWTLCEQPPNGE
jgi:CheY-like chemotaxis protein